MVNVDYGQISFISWSIILNQWPLNVIPQSHCTYESTATALSQKLSNIFPILQWLCSDVTLHSQCLSICWVVWHDYAMWSQEAQKCFRMFKSSPCNKFVAVLSWFFYGAFTKHLHASQCCHDFAGIRKAETFESIILNVIPSVQSVFLINFTEKYEHIL